MELVIVLCSNFPLPLLQPIQLFVEEAQALNITYIYITYRIKMETTTIAVRTETLKLLQKAKNEMQADSMNNVIETLLQDSKKQKDSQR